MASRIALSAFVRAVSVATKQPTSRVNVWGPLGIRARAIAVRVESVIREQESFSHRLEAETSFEKFKRGGSVESFEVFKENSLMQKRYPSEWEMRDAYDRFCHSLYKIYSSQDGGGNPARMI